MIVIGAFMAGLVVYDILFIDLYLATSNLDDSDTKFLQCPTEGNFNDFWNAWSYEYLTKYPQSDVNIQMDTWNAWVTERGCSEEWLDPLDDVIEQYGESGTPVYWYKEN